MTMTNRLYMIPGLVALIAIAVSVVTLSSQFTSAQSPDPTVASIACDEAGEADDGAETDSEEADDDNVENECGDQNEADGEDGDNNQDPQLNGSITVDESQYDGLSDEAEAAALAPLAKISEDEAAAAAQAEVPGDVSKVELENENGSLVYSVQIGGQDVKVDAGTGAVLHVESDEAED